MSALIEWNTVGAIFAESLGAGVVIVGMFALGARMIAVSNDSRTQGRTGAAPIAVAALCFLVVAAAIGYGIYYTIDK